MWSGVRLVSAVHGTPGNVRRAQKDDLERQLGRLAAFAAGSQMVVTKTTTEIGSGMNAKRPKLCRLLSDPTVTTIVVEHRDRLTRFGFEYIEAALSAQGRRVVVVTDGEVEDDLVRDVTEVLTSMCARLPKGARSASGACAATTVRRSSKRRAEAALAVARRPSAPAPEIS